MKPKSPLFSVALFAIAFSVSANVQAQENELKVSATYQIEEGHRHGWIMMKIEIPKDHHIYSLTQEGNPPPSKVVVAESDQFKLMKAFSSKEKPIVIEHDEVFAQRVEKHEGKITFMAPITVADAADLQNVKFDVKLSGQICSDKGCRLLKKPVEVAFAGFYKKQK